MQEIQNDIHSIIGQALQHAGDHVLRVSKEEYITHSWSKNDGYTTLEGQTLTGLEGHELVGKNISIARVALMTGNDVTEACKHARILHMTGDPHAVYMVISDKHTNKQAFDEDSWKLALDAAGDGMWDMNMVTREVTFSEKWHRNFDPFFNEITDGGDWQAIVHPDDNAASKEQLTRYLNGALTHYSCELRYKRKDGGYKWIQSSAVVIARAPDGTPLRAIGTHLDIDGRKLAEQQYSATQHLLSNLIEHLQDGILVIDHKDRILFANQAFCDIYEIAGSPLALKGTTQQDSIAARSLKVKDPEQFARRTTDIYNAGTLLLNDEIEFLNGKTYSRDHIPITLGEGLKGSIWKLRDVTGQKNAQQLFDAQRVFYERILNHIPSDLAVHDAAHRFLFINPSAVKDDTLRQWLIGKTHKDYCEYRNLPMDLAKEREDRFRAITATRSTVEFVERLVDREGVVSFHLRRLSPVFNAAGDIDLVIVHGANITERILAEQALKKSRDTFANAFNYSGTGMALLSPEGRWTAVNNVLCDITGYSKEELYGLTFRDITYPADLATDELIVSRLINKEITSASLEKRYISKNRKMIWTLLTISLVWNDDGTPGFFVAQIADITQRKELEAELNRKNSELEAAKISLINKVGQMDELNHMIAHNLRGPAGNIKMLSDRQEHSFDSLTQDEIMDLIFQSSNALIDSLNTLMATSQIKLDKDIAHEDCDLAEMTGNITNQLHGIIYEKHAQIITDLAVPTIHYPRVYLESIFYNMISNALKYSAPERDLLVTITTGMRNGRVTLSVKDNGLGLDLKKYEHKLFRLNQVFHSGYDSKGIGLFITKTQIESLGGSISVISEPDKGSEFIVTF